MGWDGMECDRSYIKSLPQNSPAKKHIYYFETTKDEGKSYYGTDSCRRGRDISMTTTDNLF